MILFYGEAKSKSPRLPWVKSNPKEQQQSELPRKIPRIENEVRHISLTDLYIKMKNFRAGHISNCMNERQKLTSDPEILRIVAGDTIEFNSTSLPGYGQGNSKHDQ